MSSEQGTETVAAIVSQRAHADQQRRTDTSAAPVGVPASQQRMRQRQRRQDTQQRARLMARPSLPLPPLRP